MHAAFCSFSILDKMYVDDVHSHLLTRLPDPLC